MKNYIHSPRLNYPKVNYGQSPSDRVAMGGSIYSTSLNNSVSNQNTNGLNFPNFPQNQNGIWIPKFPVSNIGGGMGLGEIILNIGNPNMDPPINPNPLEPPPFPRNPNTKGLIGNIYTFDVTLVDLPTNLDMKPFVPANMHLEYEDRNGSSICTVSNPNTSIISNITFAEYENFVLNSWYIDMFSKLILFPQFNNDEKSVKRFLRINSLVPIFYPYGKNVRFPTDIQYTFCRYDPLDNNSLVYCGLCEAHEAQWMKLYGAVPDPAQPVNFFIGTYDYSFWPNFLYKNSSTPMCERCMISKIDCYSDLPCRDIDPTIQPVTLQDIEDATADTIEKRYFRTRLDAQEELQDINDSYTDHKYIYECQKCIKIHEYCYDLFLEDNPNYADNKTVYNTLTECENDNEYFVVCEPDQQNEPSLSVVAVQHKNIPNFLRGIALSENKCVSDSFVSEEAANDFKDNVLELKYYYNENKKECVPIHTVCLCQRTEAGPNRPARVYKLGMDKNILVLDDKETCEEFHNIDNCGSGDNCACLRFDWDLEYLSWPDWQSGSGIEVWLPSSGTATFSCVGGDTVTVVCYNANGQSGSNIPLSPGAGEYNMPGGPPTGQLNAISPGALIGFAGSLVNGLCSATSFWTAPDLGFDQSIVVVGRTSYNGVPNPYSPIFEHKMLIQVGYNEENNEPILEERTVIRGTLSETLTPISSANDCQC